MKDKAIQTVQGFGTQTTELMRVDPGAAALAAQAKANVEARYIMAMHRPRNWDDVRTKLLKECARPAFAANKSTYYKKPGMAGAQGLGIRFAEVAVRCMTNVLVENTTTHDDEEKELITVMVTDLESNISYTHGVNVLKTVERSKPASDGSFISVRKNSSGKDVYTVPANDDDLLNKRNALISKAVRTLAMRIIPGDLQDEAEAIILATRQNRDAQDPDAYRKRIVDAFAAINVSAAMLEELMDQPLDTVSPAQIEELRSIHAAIKAGKTTWRVVMERVAEDLPPLDAEEPPAGMDPETGEVPPPENVQQDKEEQAKEPHPAGNTPTGNSPGFSASDVSIMIKNADSVEELDELMDLVNSMPDADKPNLMAVLEKQLAELQELQGKAS